MIKYAYHVYLGTGIAFISHIHSHICIIKLCGTLTEQLRVLKLCPKYIFGIIHPGQFFGFKNQRITTFFVLSDMTLNVYIFFTLIQVKNNVSKEVEKVEKINHSRVFLFVTSHCATISRNSSESFSFIPKYLNLKTIYSILFYDFGCTAFSELDWDLQLYSIYCYHK